MSAIVNKRKLLEAVNALVKSNDPNDNTPIAALMALQDVFSDMFDEPVVLLLRSRDEVQAEIKSALAGVSAGVPLKGE